MRCADGCNFFEIHQQIKWFVEWIEWVCKTNIGKNLNHKIWIVDIWVFTVHFFQLFCMLEDFTIKYWEKIQMEDYRFIPDRLLLWTTKALAVIICGGKITGNLSCCLFPHSMSFLKDPRKRCSWSGPKAVGQFFLVLGLNFWWTRAFFSITILFLLLFPPLPPQAVQFYSFSVLLWVDNQNAVGPPAPRQHMGRDFHSEIRTTCTTTVSGFFHRTASFAFSLEWATLYKQIFEMCSLSFESSSLSTI